MSSAFSIALSSLQANSDAINTTGNNLANLNTTGFKSSNIDFQTLVSEQLGGGGAASQYGLGVAAPINQQIFSQGTLQSSSSPLAAAIQGNGFFVVSDANNQQLFTRDGNFTLNSSGVLQSQTGQNVQGWMTTPGGINTTGAPGNIVIPTGTVLAPQATQNFSVHANLDSNAIAGSAGGTFSVPMQVVDSLGTQHQLTMTFTKSTTTPNSWSYQVSVPSSDVGGAAGTQTDLLATPGTIAFNTDGTMSTAGGTAPVPLSITGLSDGAANLSMNWNLFNSGVGTITQYGQSSALATSNQDGSAGAQFTGVSIQSGGQIVATFSNGQQKVEGQLALAAIQNPETLENVGNNNFTASASTSTPALGVPQTGGRGQIVGSSIEGSNVDMATNFTNLIVYQRGYQASSKVITTADQMSQDLLQLIH
jgi:flagellar hook protein FlgE